MRLSVVIIVSHQADQLREALEGAAAQNMEDMEVLCAYSGSEDGIWQIIVEASRRDARIRPVRFDQGTSLGSMRMGLISEARGKYMMFLDDKTVLVDGACSLIAQKMDASEPDILQFGVSLSAGGAVSQETLEEAQKAVAVCKERLNQADLYNACFLKNRYGWSLCGKLFQTTLVRRAVQGYSGSMEHPFADMIFSLRLQCLAHRYVGEEQEGLIRYIQERTEAEYASVEAYSALGDDLEELDRFLEEAGLAKDCAGAREAVRDLCADGAVTFWMREVSQKEAPGVFERLRLGFSAEEWVAACMRKQEQWNCGSRPFVDRLLGSQVFSQKPKEIRTVAAYYHRAYNGGVERAMTQLLGVWVNMGYRVVLITDEDPNPLDYAYPKEVIRVSLADGARQTTGRERLRHFLTAIRQYEIDAVVYNAWGSLTIPYDTMAIKLLGAAVIVHTHGRFSSNLAIDVVDYPDLGAELGIIYQLVDGVVTLSAADTFWWRLWGLPATKTCNPIGIRFDPERMPEKHNHDILWIGRFSYEKQPFYALEIIGKLKKQIPDIHLHMVGDCPDRDLQERIQKKVEALGIRDHVTFHGYQTDAVPYYRMCSVHLLTSMYEGMPLVLIESKAMGLPCVCFDLPNVDMVREEKGMEVVSQGDCQAAANALARLLSDEPYWKKMCAEAKESAYPICEFDQAACWKHIFQQALTRPEHKVDRDALAAITVQSQDMRFGFRQWTDRAQFLEGELEKLQERYGPVERFLRDSLIGKTLRFFKRAASRILQRT